MKVSAAILARLGAEELARRLGVSPTTVRRWAKVGVPAKRADDVARVERRHLAARTAAEHRKAQREAAFRESLPPPPNASRLPGQLEPEDVLPDAPPPTSVVKAGSEGEDRYESAGEREVDNATRYGEVFTYNIDQPAAQVDPRDIVDLALKHWIDTGRLWCFVKFYCLRYIPFNPLYKGRLVRLQGHWMPWWSSTSVRSSERSIAQSIENLFTGFQAGRHHPVRGIHEVAAERMIWMVQVQIYCLDDREKAGLGEVR